MSGADGEQVQQPVDEGTEAALAGDSLVQLGVEPRAAPSQVDGLGSEAWKAQGTQRYLFSVAETETIVLLECGAGLCPSDEAAQSLAQRAAAKAQNPRNFIDPQRPVSRPFVPRGNVKGRADMIWGPWSRFGMKVE